VQRTAKVGQCGARGGVLAAVWRRQFAARFHEAHGNADAARAAYKRALSDLAPGLLEVRRLLLMG
jgi:hypothetical protein